ncbi:MAG: hypothetical protein RIC07_20345 [Coleofasciculus sp. E1-EBD-02]
MEWIAQLQGQVVGLDSAPLIYFIEENPTYLEMTDAFFEAMVRGEFRVVTEGDNFFRSASLSSTAREHNTGSTIS